MLHHCLCSAMGMPHSTQTRIRCLGSAFFENSLDRKDMVTTARNVPGVDTPPVSGMRRINGLRGLHDLRLSHPGRTVTLGALLLVLAGFGAANLDAFGDPGHRVIGRVAE